MEKRIGGLEEDEGSDGVDLKGLAPLVDRYVDRWPKIIDDSCIGDYEVEILNSVFGLERFDRRRGIGID